MKTTSAILFTLLLAVPVLAQQQAPLCDETDTPLSCWLKYNPAPQEAAAQAADTAEETVVTANTGVSGLASPSSTALKDFLSLFSASIESSSLTTGGQALTFDYNPKIEILGAPDALKLQASLAKPELNDKYTAALGSNATALKSAEDDLTSTDNVTFSATLQPTSQRFGRSIGPHRPVFEAMLISLVPADLNAKNAALTTATIDGGIMAETQAFSTVDVTKRSATITAFENAARQQAALRKPLAALGDTFAKLLNNQPQLYGSAIYAAQKNIVGPNTFSGKVTYEMGAKNLNGFRRKYGTVCNELSMNDNATAGKCAGLLNDYAGTSELADDRLVLSLEYNRSNQRWISDPSLGVAFGYPRSHNLAFELKYGRTLMGNLAGATNGRIDAAVKYEDVTNDGDPTLNVSSRSSGSITYTMKINDTLALPLSLVYASDPGDLSDADKKLNAHFGLVYKLPAK
ncbi:MAG: hypothetical protein M3P06_02980 [Acidobacteriota bacterium]|nr:hypothetical protein [Acidobacteriota bacterium]